MSKEEVEEDTMKVGWFGRFKERMENLNRRVKPKCRRAVKSQVSLNYTWRWVSLKVVCETSAVYRKISKISWFYVFKNQKLVSVLIELKFLMKVKFERLKLNTSLLSIWTMNCINVIKAQTNNCLKLLHGIHPKLSAVVINIFIYWLNSVNMLIHITWQKPVQKFNK